MKPCPSDICLDPDDAETKIPKAEDPTTNQNRCAPEYPGKTLQFFDGCDDLDAVEQEMVQQPTLEVRGHEDATAEVFIPQDEQLAAEAELQPPPRRYPQRIRHLPDHY